MPHKNNCNPAACGYTFYVEALTNNVEILSLVSNLGQAEKLATYLSETEVATHQFWVEDYYSFARELGRRRWDLVIMAIDSKRDHIPACILRYPDTPFVAIVPRRRQHLIDELLDYGVIDVGSFSQHRRLQHSITRALREAAAHTKHHRMARQYREHETLLNSLLHSLDEPIAFVHQGAHSYVNPAYLRLLALANDTEATATPLLDLIAMRDRNRMGKLLRDLQNGKLLSAEMETRIKQGNSNIARVKFHLSQTHYQGESVTQIRIKPCTRKLSADDPGELTRKHSPASDNQFNGQDADIITALTSWTELASEALGGARLQIAAHPVAISTPMPDTTDRTPAKRFSLEAELRPVPGSVQSIEKLVADLRRLDLLEGFDQWLLYNAASALAKRLRISEDCFFYVNLFSKGEQLLKFSNWLPLLTKKFQLPENRLNVIVDINGLTGTAEESMHVVNSLRTQGIGVGMVETLNVAGSVASLELLNQLAGAESGTVDPIGEDSPCLDNTHKMPVDFKFHEPYQPQGNTASLVIGSKRGVEGFPDLENKWPRATSITSLSQDVAAAGADSSHLIDQQASKPGKTRIVRDRGKESLDLTLAILKPPLKPATVN